MEDFYQSIYYQNVKQINYLNDLKLQNKGKGAQFQNFNSDRETFGSIAEKLYKKIVKQGYIEKPKEFAIPQIKKKDQNKYDLCDKWIDDEEVFTEAETEKTSNGFSHFKALSGVTIEEFYKSHNHHKLQGKNDPNRALPNKISEILKNPLTVVKFGELKKKIQSNLRESSKSKTDVLERQTMK